MILIAHILVALGGLISTGWSFIVPSKSKLRLSYGLVVATFVTGTYLVVSHPAHLTQTCAEGLVYLAVVGLGIFAANKKLVQIQSV